MPLRGDAGQMIPSRKGLFTNSVLDPTPNNPDIRTSTHADLVYRTILRLVPSKRETKLLHIDEMTDCDLRTVNPRSTGRALWKPKLPRRAGTVINLNHCHGTW